MGEFFFFGNFFLFFFFSNEEFFTGKKFFFGIFFFFRRILHRILQRGKSGWRPKPPKNFLNVPHPGMCGSKNVFADVWPSVGHHGGVHTCHTIACNPREYTQKTTNMVGFGKPPARVTKLHPSPPWPSGCPFGRSGPPSRAPSGSGGREGNI